MRRSVLHVCCLTLLIAALCSPVSAGKFLIDGLHGQQRLSFFMLDINLDSLYADSKFSLLGVNHLPIYDVLAAGTLDGVDWDTIVVNVPLGTPTLYAALPDYTPPQPGEPVVQYVWLEIRTPNQTIIPGAYGICHIDDPEPGEYTIYAGYQFGGRAYIIGTGPHIWDVFPPDDYDAILSFHTNIWMFFVGIPPDRSDADMNALQAAMTNGLGVGVFYDGAEPIAEKPIIRVRNFAEQGATVRLDLPAALTYAEPEPASREPLVWDIAPTTGEIELDYEARFKQPLNFARYDRVSQTIVNDSWATLRDVKLIEFVPDRGYAIQKIGTLLPNEKAACGRGAAKSFDLAVSDLSQTMRAEARTAGLTAEETESFFSRCDWAMRILPHSCLEPGVLALYRLEDSDYDALFPLTTTPVPAEKKRVLWVESWLPDRVTARHAVHPPLPVVPAMSESPVGEYHEYGVFRETYGGDALDDMDLWGWHFFDSPLIDTSDVGDEWHSYWFDTWGPSPLAAQLSSGINRLEGMWTGGMTDIEGTSTTVLSGDEDTYSEDGFFLPGSYPAVVMARENPSGGKVIGTGDCAFLSGLADNQQFGSNVFAWLHGTHTENVPDIDIPQAVIAYDLRVGQTWTSTVWIYNRGDVGLDMNTILPADVWLTTEGPTTATIAAGDSLAYIFHWSDGGLPPDYYSIFWTITSNDPNESEFQRLIRIHIYDLESVDPPIDGSANNFRLNPPYPNPFNPSTTISYTLSRDGHVRLGVFDLLGREVVVLADEMTSAGEHRVSFDGSAMSSGIYFARMQSGNFAATQKLLLLK